LMVDAPWAFGFHFPIFAFRFAPSLFALSPCTQGLAVRQNLRDSHKRDFSKKFERKSSGLRIADE